VLAQAYYTSTPPDYLNCAWYATRAANFAPAAFKPTIQTLATYCYKKFHGGTDGYDAIQTAVATNLNPPSGLLAGIKPAPKPEDYVKQLIATTSDLATLAVSDREFGLQYGSSDDADKLFASVKGKTVEFPDVLVIAATESSIQVAVSDDSVQAKTADFTFTMKEPLKTVPAVGAKVSLDGTYDSYTQKPLMITMIDGSVVEKKAPAKAPVRRRPTHYTVRNKQTERPPSREAALFAANLLPLPRSCGASGNGGRGICCHQVDEQAIRSGDSFRQLPI
jgi:hypothetical protein